MISGLSFTWPDYVIIAVIGLSTLISLIRGFVREAFSLIVWVVAIWLAFEFSPNLSEPFKAFVGSESIRLIIAFFVILVVVVIVGAILNYLFSLLVRKSGLSGTDRLIGIIFGAARGVMVVGALVLIGNLSAVGKTNSWQDAQLLPYFDGLANWMGGFIPDQFKELEMSSFIPVKSNEKPEKTEVPKVSNEPSSMSIERISN